MAKPVPRKENARLNAATRKLFLGHLAQTANVAASARVAGINSNAVYDERLRSAEFRGQWSGALAEGYARLEAHLLAEALQAADGKIADGTLKARAQKHRLRLSLLGLHRASVKGGATCAPTPAKADLRAIKAKLILQLTQMRERAGIPLNGLCPHHPTRRGGGDT